jgi:hypothetical protein
MLILIAGWNVAQGSGDLGADGTADYWANTTIGPGSYNVRHSAIIPIATLTCLKIASL